MIWHLRKVLLWLVIPTFCLCAAPHPLLAETRIAVLVSDSLTSTSRTVRGAYKTISRVRDDAQFHQFTVCGRPESVKLAIDSIKAFKPRLVLTIGSQATQVAKDNFSRTPVIFAGVMYPVLSEFVESIGRPGGNITGASLDIPTHIQFKYFKKIIPDLRNIGVLYTAATASLIPPAKVIARDMGLSLVAIRIENNRQIPSALDSLAGFVQGIWSVADPDLFDPQTTRYLLLNTLRKNLPFMGFSRNVVESGALFALDFDYKAVGAQAGKIALRVLGGESPARIRVSAVDVIWFHYNEKTAHHINVNVPDDLVAIAKEVYR